MVRASVSPGVVVGNDTVSKSSGPLPTPQTNLVPPASTAPYRASGPLFSICTTPIEKLMTVPAIPPTIPAGLLVLPAQGQTLRIRLYHGPAATSTAFLPTAHL